MTSAPASAPGRPCVCTPRTCCHHPPHRCPQSLQLLSPPGAATFGPAERAVTTLGSRYHDPRNRLSRPSAPTDSNHGTFKCLNLNHLAADRTALARQGTVTAAYRCSKSRVLVEQVSRPRMLLPPLRHKVPRSGTRAARRVQSLPPNGSPTALAPAGGLASAAVNPRSRISNFRARVSECPVTDQ